MGKPITACDNCRRSRIGCNASFSLGRACFNCERKGAKCSFSVKSVPTVLKEQQEPHVPWEASLLDNRDQQSLLDDSNDSSDDLADLSLSPSACFTIPSMTTVSDSLAKCQQASRLHHLLWNVFTTLLEPRIGLWIGGAGCPFLTTNTKSTALISRLMINLDRSPARPARHNGHLHSILTDFRNDDHHGTVANRALLHAVYAYSVRWLHLSHDKHNKASQTQSQFVSMKRDLSSSLWTLARSQMFTIMSRPSYRSSLALYLFAAIPTSLHKDGDNIEDLCLESSLSQLNYLNSRAQTPLPHQDAITSLFDGLSSSQTCEASGHTNVPQDIEKQEFKSMSSIAFWFGIIADTTRSLTRCRPSILLPGYSGETKVWDTVRQRSQVFEKQYGWLRRTRTPFSNNQVITILQHAFAYKTLIWAAITRVQDALVHQISGVTLAEAVEAVREETNKYEAIFEQLVCMCQRDFKLLDRTTQMCYTLLTIHFQVGNLILADILPSTFVFIDQNFNLYDLRLCACRTIIVAIDLALHTSYFKTEDFPTLNILLLDPYPDILANAIIRTGSSLFILYEMQKLPQPNMNAMFEVVMAALEVLSSISQTASEAIPLLQRKFDISTIDRLSAFKDDPLQHAAISMASPHDQGLFSDEVVRELEQQAMEPTLIDQSIERAEKGSAPHGDSPFQAWTFNDCFTTF